jgi:hypothetical protein
MPPRPCSEDVSAADSPVVKYGMSHRAEEPACEPACPWKSTSDPAPPDLWTLEREGVMRLDHSQRWDAGDLPPPDGRVTRDTRVLGQSTSRPCTLKRSSMLKLS